MNHFTNKKGWNAIRARSPWRFLAKKPPSNHLRGAYFTTLEPGVPNLARKLFIPKTKTEYVFPFSDIGDLIPLNGGRGSFIFYSPKDYDVESSRQGIARRL